MASLAAGAPSPAAAPAAGVDFDGVWSEVSLHKLDAFLCAMGVGWVKRKAACALIKLKTQRHTIKHEGGSDDGNKTGERIRIKVEGKPNGTEEKTENR